MHNWRAEIVRPDAIFMDNEVCPHNRAVDCPERDKCGKCGWNPANVELHNRRVYKALEARKLWDGE